MGIEITVKNEDGEKSKFNIQDKEIVDYLQEDWVNIEQRLNLSLRIGIIAIKATSTSVDTNYIDKEFQKLQYSFDERFRKFQEEWDQGVRSVFGDDFRNMQECMDPNGDDTPTAKFLDMIDKKMKDLLAEMDPSDTDTPIGKFKKEMIDRMTEIVQEINVKKAVQEEKSKGTAKGVEYEEAVYQTLLEIGTCLRDTIQATGSDPGVGGNKKGDIMISLSDVPDLKIVVEAKKKKIVLNQKFYDDEIRGGMENRSASSAILVVHPDFNPGNLPLHFFKEAIVAEYDPEVDDRTAIIVAYQLARRIALEKSKGREELDLSQFRSHLSTISAYVDHISKIEGAITNSIRNLESVREDVKSTKLKLKEALDQLMSDLDEGDDDGSLLSKLPEDDLRGEGGSPVL